MGTREENVIKTALEIFGILKRESRYVARSELAEKLGISEKTLERRINDIRTSQTDYYVLSDKKSGYRLIKRKQDLPKGAATKKAQPTKVTNDDIYDEKFNTKIKAIHEAIERRIWVILHDYKTSNGQVPEDKKVIPVALFIDSADALVLAAKDVGDSKPYSYKLSRCQGVKQLYSFDVAEHRIDLSKVQFDDFGLAFYEGSSVYRAELYLTSYSAAMIIHDFKTLGGRIEELKPTEYIKKLINGKEYRYIYVLTLNVCHIGALGRMVCGMLDHIIVKTDNAELTDMLRKYVEKTVFNAFEENLKRIPG